MPCCSARTHSGVPEYQAPSVSAGGVSVGVACFADGIVEGVGDDAVVFGVESGDEGVVVGEGDRGVGGNHALGGGGSLFGEGEEVFGVVFFGVVVAESVEGDHDDIVFGLLGGGVGGVVGVDYGEGCSASPASASEQRSVSRAEMCLAAGRIRMIG